MCHVIFMSTTSTQDFSGVDGEHFLLERLAEVETEPAARVLGYPNRWFLAGRYGGCSCHFRHFLRENPPEFWEPQEWFEEDAEDVDATRAFYDLMVGLVNSGHDLDLGIAWEGEVASRTMEVSLREVSREAFRFLDGSRLVIRP